MTLQEIKEQLQNDFSGVRTDALEQLGNSILLTATTDEEISNTLQNLTEEKVKTFAKNFSSTLDKKVTESTRTFENNLKKKYKFVEIEDGEDPNEPNPGAPSGGGEQGDISEIVKKAVSEAVKPFQEQIHHFNAKEIAASRKQALEQSLNDAPNAFKAKVLKDFGRMSFEDDESFNNYLDETKTDLSAFNQELADKGLAGQGKPLFGAADKDGVSSGVSNYLESKTEAGKGAFTGKQLN